MYCCFRDYNLFLSLKYLKRKKNVSSCITQATIGPLYHKGIMSHSRRMAGSHSFKKRWLHFDSVKQSRSAKNKKDKIKRKKKQKKKKKKKKKRWNGCRELTSVDFQVAFHFSGSPAWSLQRGLLFEFFFLEGGFCFWDFSSPSIGLLSSFLRVLWSRQQVTAASSYFQ